MMKDRIALDLPFYDGLLAGHYQKSSGYTSRRAEGTDDWLLIATLSGKGIINTRTGEIEMERGRLILIPPGFPHDYGIAKASDSWELLWVHFHPPTEWREMLGWVDSEAGIGVLDGTPVGWAEIESTFWDVHRCAHSPRRSRLKLAMNALERLLILCEDEAPSSHPSFDPRIQAAIDYLLADLSRPISLKGLSERAYLSPSRFAHLFREQMGMAPLQYVSLQRIRRSSLLLERTTLSIAEIAEQVGMDPFQFSAKFRMETGMSPRAYRKLKG